VIKILDNFFDDEKHKQIMHHIKSNLYFKPRFFDGSTEKTKKTHYGNRFNLKNDQNLYNFFVKEAEKNFKLKIHKTLDDGIDIRNLSEWQPHIDDKNKSNVLIMLDGPIGVTTGTVFYTDGEIDIHVGFRPNRAVMFPSNYYHSAHKNDMKNLTRYTATLFLVEYEELIK
tara:strand:+ start:489 stop:998 length:510 start_codon:yes stop_codon:yes gene_type:complete